MNLEEQLGQLRQELKLLWGNRRDFIIALAVVLVAVALGYYLAYPEYDKISGNQEAVTNVGEEIDNLESRSQAWQTALNNPDYQEKAGLVDRILPSHKPVLETIYLFNDLVNNHAVYMNKFDFAPGEVATSGAQTAEQRQRRAANSRNYLVINFNITGQYDDLLRFLQSTERTAPIGSVAEAQISRSDQGVSSARVTYYAYYFDQPTAGQTATTNLPRITQAESEILADLVNYYLLRDIEMDQTLDPNMVKNDLFSEITREVVTPPTGNVTGGEEGAGGTVAIDTEF